METTNTTTNNQDFNMKNMYIPRAKTDEERKERIKATKKRYYKRNKDKVREYNKKYYQRRKELIKKALELENQTK